MSINSSGSAGGADGRDEVVAADGGGAERGGLGGFPAEHPPGAAAEGDQDEEDQECLFHARTWFLMLQTER
jgi:hypothetical protein